jgi:uncharacterized protein
MHRLTRLSLALALLLSSLACARAQDSGLFLDGMWAGSVDLGEGEETLELRLFPADRETGAPAGGLVDMPSRGLFGYPMGDLRRGPEGMSFDLLGDAPFDGAFSLSGSPSVSDGSFGAKGRLRLLSGAGAEAKPLAEGRFSLAYVGDSSRGAAFGSDYSVDTGKGLLRGSLLMPGDEDSSGGDAAAMRAELGLAMPVVLLLSGAQADRDGNNYAVPGRSDALAELAMALRSLGVASLRYDKRGSGESYRLGSNEEELRFDDHIADARSALGALADDRRFSSVLVVGFAEGALVGACALEELLASGKEASGRFAGLAALCASGESEREVARRSLEGAPEGLRGEAEAIMAALESGKRYPNPSAYFADYFRPSAQGYLSSLFVRDIRQAVATLPARVLVVAGGSDLQTSGSQSELLASARGDVAYRVIPGMSHALKAVGEDEEKNYASFTDPSLPLAEGLPELLAAFADWRDAPGQDPRANAEPPTPALAPAATPGAVLEPGAGDGSLSGAAEDPADPALEGADEGSSR